MKVFLASCKIDHKTFAHPDTDAYLLVSCNRTSAIRKIRTLTMKRKPQKFGFVVGNIEIVEIADQELLGLISGVYKKNCAKKKRRKS